MIGGLIGVAIIIGIGLLEKYLHKKYYSLKETDVMSNFEIKQCELLATYTPYSYERVHYWFLHCGRSFDKTLTKLENMTEDNL